MVCLLVTVLLGFLKDSCCVSVWPSQHHYDLCGCNTLYVPEICEHDCRAWWCNVSSLDYTFDICFLNVSFHSNCEVLTTLTPDTGRILSKLHAVQPRGKISFCTGIRVAHVSLPVHSALHTACHWWHLWVEQFYFYLVSECFVYQCLSPCSWLWNIDKGRITRCASSPL